MNAQSGCTGGAAYMCHNQQPWNVSSTLSYGYAAAYISVNISCIVIIKNAIETIVFRDNENGIGVVLVIL